MKNYNKIRSENNELLKLQDFKQPFTNFIERFIYSNVEFSHEDLCEFFLLQDSEEEFTNLNLELEITSLKLARLLELKEKQLKDNILKEFRK